MQSYNLYGINMHSSLRDIWNAKLEMCQTSWINQESDSLIGSYTVKKTGLLPENSLISNQNFSIQMCINRH